MIIFVSLTINMRKEETLILDRDDLINSSRDKTIADINFMDFKISLKPAREVNIVLFMDDNGESKVLKNRYGDEGRVMGKQKNALDSEIKWELKARLARTVYAKTNKTDERATELMNIHRKFIDNVRNVMGPNQIADWLYRYELSLRIEYAKH